MRYSISDTAEYGDYRTGKRIITEETRKGDEEDPARDQDGTFASEWIQENRAGGRAHFLANRALEADTQLEETGKLRGMMSWLKKVIRSVASHYFYRGLQSPLYTKGWFRRNRLRYLE